MQRSTRFQSARTRRLRTQRWSGARTLAAEVLTPYVTRSASGHRLLGGLGYVGAARGDHGAGRAYLLGFGAVVCPSGSVLTRAGTLVGLRVSGEAVPVYGICVRRDAGRQGERVAKAAANWRR